MVNRTHPDAPAGIALTRLERDLLDELFPPPVEQASHFPLGRYLLCEVARLGGYLARARARDPVPGNIVMWRGLSRLNDLSLGYALHRVVGN